jgi:hypothetical protein
MSQLLADGMVLQEMTLMPAQHHRNTAEQQPG